MQITLATPDDIETLFDIRTSVGQNHQSREDLAALAVTADRLAEMLHTRSRAWLARAHAEHSRLAGINDVQDAAG